MKYHFFNISSIMLNKNVVDEFYNYFAFEYFSTLAISSAPKKCAGIILQHH